jgi:hypothetical protein
MSLSSRILALGLAVVFAVSPARAGEVDRYLPADTEVYNVVNIRQILSSALVKKVGVDNIRALLNQQQDLTDALKDLGLDPLKDIDRIISTGPSSGEQDKGLVIVHGRFDVEKFRERAKKDKEVIKPLKIGGEECYEVVISDANLSLFVGFASNKTILAAMSKDYLGDALKVKPTDKAALKNKAFQEMLEKLDDKQSMALVMNGDVLTKGPLADSPVKDTLAKIKTISGGITLTDGIKIELVGGTKTADDAKELKDQLGNWINAGIGFAGLAAMQNKQLAPLIDFMKSIRTTSKDKSITIKAEITAEDLGKLTPKDQ